MGRRTLPAFVSVIVVGVQFFASATHVCVCVCFSLSLNHVLRLGGPSRGALLPPLPSRLSPYPHSILGPRTLQRGGPSVQVVLEVGSAYWEKIQ